jgi:hypothetical protein
LSKFRQVSVPSLIAFPLVICCVGLEGFLGRRVDEEGYLQSDQSWCGARRLNYIIHWAPFSCNFPLEASFRQARLAFKFFDR